MDEQRQDDQLEPIYKSSVPIQDEALENCRKQCTIEKGGEKRSGISVLIMQHDDDDALHLALNNRQGLICHKTKQAKPNQTTKGVINHLTI